jgi:ABC-2 type transport system permease protein
VLPTAAILARLIDFLFSLGVLGVFVAAYRIPIHWTLFWLIPIISLQLVFTWGMGFLAASLNVLYRDVTQLIALLLMVWVWVAPVMVSSSGHALWIRSIFLLDPMGGLIQAERDVIFSGHLTSPVSLWSAAAWAVFVFFGGLTTFKRIEPLFSEVL